MSGTAKTISTLMSQVQDLVASIEVRMGGQGINLVTSQEYGADPTGLSEYSRLRSC